jgi:hypothetical protein
MQNARKKSITLSFYRKNLLYDIENCAFVEGDIMPTDNENTRHQVIDIGQDANIDRVTRMLDLAFAECVEFMYPYTKVPCEDGTQDNDLRETSVYVVEMLVDADFSQSSTNLIAKLVHEYMVCRVLGDWLRITNPDNRSGWDVKAEEIKNQIRVRLNARCGRVRRRQTPF